MSLLYKSKFSQKLSVDIVKIESSNEYRFLFTKDCGKFGTDEIIDLFNLTPDRLLQILQEREDLTENEL